MEINKLKCWENTLVKILLEILLLFFWFSKFLQWIHAAFIIRKKRKNKEQHSRTYSRGGKPALSQTTCATATPTCIDDHANNSFRVSDGASSQQQVFFIQPSLFPIVMYTVEEKVACITWMLPSTSCPKKHYLGEGRPRRWSGKGHGELQEWVACLSGSLQEPRGSWCSLVTAQDS